jgi:hypothetical protein
MPYLRAREYGFVPLRLVVSHGAVVVGLVLAAHLLAALRPHSNRYAPDMLTAPLSKGPGGFFIEIAV